MSALRVKADGSQSYEVVARYDEARKRWVSQPLAAGAEGDQLFLLLFGTGIRNRGALEQVSVRLGGQNIPVLYAGAQSEFAGLDQVNVLLPRELLGRGELDLVLTVDGQEANAVRIHTGGASVAVESLAAPSRVRREVNAAERGVIVPPTVPLTFAPR